MDEVRIQHVFRDPETGFCDAIVLPIEDYELLDVDAIEALKAERVANWQAALDAPQPEPVEPTKEDLEAEAQSFLDEVALLGARKQALIAKLDDANGKLDIDLDLLNALDALRVEGAVEAAADIKVAVAEGK